jgi:hypothetical protein
MRTTQLTNILLIILLLINVAFLGKWWMEQHKFHHTKKDVKTETTMLLHDRTKGGVFLAKTLGLDTLQQKKLDTILGAHFTFLNKYMGAYIRTQSEFFTALKNNQDSTVAFHYVDSLGLLKVSMERELYLHLLRIKNICNTAQQKQYNQLIDNMSMDFVHSHDFLNNTKPTHDSL